MVEMVVVLVDYRARMAAEVISMQRGGSALAAEVISMQNDVWCFLLKILYNLS
jgi:hypothetical protein